MWNFDDESQFALVHYFVMGAIYTWGAEDRSKRENIRKAAKKGFPENVDCRWYGFRIKVERNRTGRPLDLENVPKLIINAFSAWQINRDRSFHHKLGLFADDSLDYVRAMQVEGAFSSTGKDKTEVWVFGKK